MLKTWNFGVNVESKKASVACERLERHAKMLVLPQAELIVTRDCSVKYWSGEKLRITNGLLFHRQACDPPVQHFADFSCKHGE